MKSSLFPLRPCRTWQALVLSISAAICASCSGSSREPVFPTRGQVFYQGKPVPHALVVLHSLEKKEGQQVRPHGFVDQEGRFTLTTYDPEDGAPPGEYAVTVEWWLVKSANKAQEGEDPPPLNYLPTRYSKAQTSGIRVRITEGNNDIPTIHLR
jgi:hypothetical protein